ncbi:hypothetical protein PR048_023231 [Dryococelus australis]|uniref:Uncharacterized protein n=1 Tax=Dryococelus australis TaxID=614101 RepID=A0ABQ9GTH5_9NEOP|nr:hypothetical protein PR048_023231 [Dryococelus australis]
MVGKVEGGGGETLSLSAEAHGNSATPARHILTQDVLAAGTNTSRYLLLSLAARKTFKRCRCRFSVLRPTESSPLAVRQERADTVPQRTDAGEIAVCKGNGGTSEPQRLESAQTRVSCALESREKYADHGRCSAVLLGAPRIATTRQWDNAQCHRPKLSRICSEEQSGECQRFLRPLRSPLMNPTEHLWDVVGRRVGRRAVRCWDTEVGCAQPARSLYHIFSPRHSRELTGQGRAVTLLHARGSLTLGYGKQSWSNEVDCVAGRQDKTRRRPRLRRCPGHPSRRRPRHAAFSLATPGTPDSRSRRHSTATLNFTVLYALEPASYLHRLLHRCEDTPSLTELHRGRSGVVVRLLAYHPGEPGSIPGGVAPGFLQVGIVPVGMFSRGSSVSPTLAFRHRSILTSLYPHRLSRPRC